MTKFSSCNFLRDENGVDFSYSDSHLKKDDYTVEYSEEEKRLYITAPGCSKIINIKDTDDIDNIECGFEERLNLLSIRIPAIKQQTRTKIKIN